MRNWSGMDPECFPIATLPGVSALFKDFAEREGATPAQAAALRRWFPADPFSLGWARDAPSLSEAHRESLADLLREQGEKFGASASALENIERLRAGAAAVVTGQQVALFGGPLLTLLKAATAIRKAKDATAASGREHVPIFWLATEDHDLAEVDQVGLLQKNTPVTVKLGLQASRPVPVGAFPVDGVGEQGREALEAALDQASELLGWGPAADLLRSCYAPGATLSSAFGSFLSQVFASEGLIVIDAASRAFHALGAPVLRAAIESADALEAALLKRDEELRGLGYHAQVHVSPGHSLLFLLDGETGARLPLRRKDSGEWKAGSQTYSEADLLAILAESPERLSPNALLRPVFQDCVLPTSAYVAGPAEIAYFAQSAVVYERVLGRVTAVLPRLSATLVDAAIASVMQQHEVGLTQVIESKTADALALRFGARAMPIEGKRGLASVGNAMDAELTALGDYLSQLSPELGRAAGVSASKMRYQMNRLRRLAAAFEVQKSASLRKHADALMANLYPEEHLQERVLGSVWFVARFGEGLAEFLVQHAGQECPGHRVLYL